ncbi:response regulator transcription factor [Actinoplanes sp. N902-109]|uniref:LuxR C-terminal-related transcriptional regulator n=1 Tax=Actinoplanes sp. (strain N902-109) TaxID=649831 RepID=UPI0005A2FA02|nr:response regulator transcription factor [Actinoplanes sp. N902-109]
MTAAARTVRVLLVHDQPMLRSGLRLALTEGAGVPVGSRPGAAGVTVVGEAGDGAEAVDLARRLLPDVVVMAARLPRMDGLAATRAIVSAGLPVRVLITIAYEADDVVLGAVAAGAAGCLGRDVPPAELVHAVHTVATGGAVMTPPVLGRLLNRVAELLPAAETTPAAPVLATLTDREREVLVHVARGHSNAEIAAALSVSETTVKTHVGHVLTKLRVRDRVQAVVLAYETGLVRPGR